MTGILIEYYWREFMVKHSYEYVKEFMGKEGFTLLSDTYNGARDKLLVRCEHGHEYSVKFNNFKSGNRCPECAFKSNKPYEHEYVRLKFLESDFIMLDQYTNTHKPIKVYCRKCEKIFMISFHNFDFFKRGCPHCHFKAQSKRSKFESSCMDWLLTFVPESIMDVNCIDMIVNPETGRKLELDIFFPSMNKALELQGTYHFKRTHATTKRDQLKRDLCEARGIDLKYIAHFDFDDNREAVKEFVVRWLSL